MILNADGEVTGGTIEALVRKLTLHEKSPGNKTNPTNPTSPHIFF